MDILQNSLLGRIGLALWMYLNRWYDNSVLAVIFRGVASYVKAFWAGSLFGRVLSREGAISRGWEGSLFCRLLSMLINLPGLLLKALYRSARPVFEGSIAAKLGFAIAENTPVAVGWLMFVMLVAPFELWNNAYGLAGFALVFALAILSGVRKKTRRLDVVSSGPYAVFFAGLMVLAVPLSLYIQLSMRFLAYHLTCALCVIVIVSTVEKLSQLLRLAGMASFGLVVTSAYGVLQRIQGVEVNPSYVDLTLNKDMPGRVFSVFENPNAFGEVLVMLIPVAIALMFASRGWGGRILGAASAILGSVSLVMTYSRAGWIGIAVAAVVFVFLWKKKLLPAIILLGIAAVPLLPDAVFNRVLTIFNPADTSTSSRFPLYEAALRLIEARPLQGAGLGSEAVRKAVTDGNLYYGVAPFVHSHNVYLQVWAESGLLGLLALLGTVGWTVKRAVKTVFGKTGNVATRMLVIGSVSSLVGIMVCGVADFIWHYPRVMVIFWFVFALAISGIRLAIREERAAARQNKEHEMT